MSTILPSWFSSSYRMRDAEPSQNHVESESTAIEVRISVYPLGEDHPLARVFGAFDTDPYFDDWMKAIAEYREEVNARENE
ncbi:MAG: hypothetical protein HY231_19395 [Acidobacteria bacterium]|nr:hypothetical protein [Acidobacteriota bacterium]